jgi:hypothetical protein
MSVHFADLTRQAALDGMIHDAEVLALRQSGWADGAIAREEAEAIFALQQATANPSPVWSDFFVEALRNFVLNGSEPRGYASDDEAQWLIGMVEADGKVCSMTELELLVQVIEKGLGVPDALKVYVLKVIEAAVLTGTGPTRDGGHLSDTHVSVAEARILRRVVFGSASDKPGAVSLREAEMLFRLKDATLHQANAPEFQQIFVQGVGNALMGFANEAAHVSRERMLQLEKFVADNKPQLGRFMGQMAREVPNVFGVVFGKRSNAPGREEQVAQAEAIVPFEQEWLDAQIAANGQIDAYDRALLDFIERG